MMKSNYTCDVLIIGGGSAGLRAAIEAHDAGANVLIISTSKKGDPHTTLARAAAIFKTESIRQNILFFSTG
ncbi:MAG: FAD-binding protein [Nitrososphaeraceae archaeon]|jgi:succinate dehydrogenase/fumarate reductase flavoprotein subunit